MTQPSPIEQLIDELTAFVRSGEALLQALDGNTGGEMHEAGQRAEEALAAAKEHLTQLQDRLVSEARAAVNAGERYLREAPWKAIAVAAGIGFLLGTLLSRRRSG
jgi:ElaB/YqjD/DUF883 family membrane-anchored ribosome-binding protein